MSTKLSVSATGDTPGTIPFQIGANGKLAVAAPAQPAAPMEAPALPAATPETPETPSAPSTPFQRMYPGVDPGKVEFFFDDTTKRLKYREIAQETPAEPAPEETPVEAPPTPEPTPAPTQPDEIAQLRTQFNQQNQLTQAMLIAQATGKPLAEVLGLPTQPTEPDYSEVDMYDPAQAAKLMRDVVKAEIQSFTQQHQSLWEGARVQQEYSAAELEFRSDPQYQPRMLAALQLVADLRQNGVPISIKQAYIAASKLSPTAATPTQATANQATKTTLTPEQAAAKAEQAARLPQSGGVRGAGKAVPPEGLKKTRDLLIWGMHQDALGNLH